MSKVFVFQILQSAYISTLSDKWLQHGLCLYSYNMEYTELQKVKLSRCMHDNIWLKCVWYCDLHRLYRDNTCRWKVSHLHVVDFKHSEKGGWTNHIGPLLKIQPGPWCFCHHKISKEKLSLLINRYSLYPKPLDMLHTGSLMCYNLVKIYTLFFKIKHLNHT